jgi:hypothetical protein
MPIKPRSQEELPKQAEFSKTIKLNVPGDYIAEVVDTRMNLADDRFNESYYFDFKVLEGPANVGVEAHVCKYPDDAKGGKNKRTGQTFSSKQAQQKDKDRVQQWAIACLGLGWDQAGLFADDEKYAGLWDEMFTGEDAETRVRGSSPAAGNKILVRCKSNGKSGDDERFYSEIYPFKEGDKASAAPKAAVAPASTKKATPPPPPKKEAKPTFEKAAEDAGFVPYPGMETEYMIRMEGGEQVETVEIADVRKSLGY